MSEPLPIEKIHERLASLPGWVFRDSRIHRTLKLASFPDALAFIVQVGLIAERLNHHPHLTNLYRTVELSLTTHDANNQVTELDLAFAHAVNQLSLVKNLP